MENHLVSENRSRDPLASARHGHMKESMRLGYQLKYESSNVTHADIRSEMVNDVKTLPIRSSEVLQKQQDNGKGHRSEELVRYMSNLPSFLKKDVKLNEKAFSVGVLDWKLLENWQNFHNIDNQHSSASSSISPFSLSGGSSSHSCGGHSLSPAQQKHPYPTLQSHFDATPLENCSHDTESSVVNKLKPQDCKALPSVPLGVQQTTLGTRLPSDKKVEYRRRDCKAKDSKVAKSSIVRKSQSLEDVGEKMKIQEPESLSRHSEIRASFEHYTTNDVDARKQETPTYELGNKYPQTRMSLKLTDTKIFGSKKASHLSFPNAENFEASCIELSCNMPHSCSPHEADPSQPRIEEPFSCVSQDNKNSNDLFQRFSECGDVSVNNYRGKKLQEEKSIPAAKDNVLVNPHNAYNTETGSSETTKVRNPSPTRRFSFSWSRVGKVSGSCPTSNVLQPNARNPLGSSGAEESCISSSSLNNPKARSKGRSSSPLRRLLDPLIGPAKASMSDSKSSEPASKSSEGHGKSSAHSVKVKLDLRTCKNADAEVPHCSSKSPTVQALLQVAVRNGFPLFTFAVDGKNDILAATMRKSRSDKEEFSSIYSFFIVQEMKKHSGSWINNGRKDKGNSFVHNIVAQMKVTDTFKQNSLDQCISKKYVLFSYDTKQAETSDLELNDELAAVVVKIPRKSTSNFCQNWQGYENSVDSPASKVNQTHPLPSFKCNSGLGNRGENRTEDQLSLTVLLPGGHHGQPIKGEPFSLVERWKSGGSCDCGGWDLGCRIRVLTDNAQFHQRSSSAKPHQTPKLLQLFSQDENDQKQVFSLALFKDGIYSVEFNSSIEILQAFSISLSILSCLKPGEFVEMSNGLNKNSSADVTVSETGGIKVYSKTQTEVPAFVSNPPLSPVGRV